MNDEDYTYDIAISFLAQDEGVATSLSDLLQDRLKVFLYSKKQEDLAGKDGEIEFNSVFSEQSRMVAVFYRSGWGESPWTRIEETAIRNRAYEHGYDFVTFIPLDDKKQVPTWLPKTQLYVGLSRWGIEGVASVIEARVQELGGQVSEESIEDRAKRLERSLKSEEIKKQFNNSTEGVNKAYSEFVIMVNEIERLLEVIKSSANTIQYSLEKLNKYAILLGPHAGMSIDWYCKFANTLDKSKLEVSLWNGHPPHPNKTSWDKPRKLKSISFNFDLLSADNFGWKLIDSKKRELSSIKLAEYILKYYMDDAAPK